MNTMDPPPRPRLTLDVNMNTKVKRPDSLPFITDFGLTPCSGKERLLSPIFSTLLTPGGRTYDPVCLPGRYKQKVSRQTQEGVVSTTPTKPSDREKDLGLAIKWIKQEIMLLKQQDRLLMRQLLDLRSTIHQLRVARSYYISGTDPTSSDDSWVSFGSDSCLSAPCLDSPITNADLLAAFRSRTMAMKSVPNSPGERRTPKFYQYNINGSQLGKSLDVNITMV